MDLSILNDLLIILGLSSVVIFVFNKINVPPVVGYLLTGILIGPFAFKLVSEVKQVELLAEIGLVLILFTVGIEFSISDLLKVKKAMFLGGAIQVVLTTAIALFILNCFGLKWIEAFVLGFSISLSSTAVVVKILQTKEILFSPQGRITLAIEIFQDLSLFPIILILPIFSESSSDFSLPIIFLVLKAILIIIAVVVLAKFVFPKLMDIVAKTRIKELFLIVTILICLLIVWLADVAGLSLALGAFLAGLIISETDYKHEAYGNIIPFRDIFSSFFFVSVGMLLNIHFFIENVFLIICLLILLIALKVFTGSFATLILGFPARIAILVGFALAQIGEIAFVVTQAGLKEGLLSMDLYQMFLAVAILSLGFTPFLLEVSPVLAHKASRINFVHKFEPKEKSCNTAETVKKNHLVIIGYGINGRNLASAAKASQIDYVIIEMNPNTVREEKKKGEPIIFGDASQEEVLKAANIKEGKVAVVAISDAGATRSITNIIKKLNPAIYLIVRTRFIQDVDALYKLGADEVIPEEYETSIEIFTRVLTRYLIPRQEIESFICELRSSTYQMLRKPSVTKTAFRDLKSYIPDYDIVPVRLDGNSKFISKSLMEIQLPVKYGINVIAVRRNNEIIANPPASTVLQENDILICFGSTKNILNTFES